MNIKILAPPGYTARFTHWIGGWAVTRADMDGVERRKFLTLPGPELRPLGRSASSQSLYRLRCSYSFRRGFLSEFLYAFITSPILVTSPNHTLPLLTTLESPYKLRRSWLCIIRNSPLTALTFLGFNIFFRAPCKLK
jgi:hypothetical protein